MELIPSEILRRAKSDPEASRPLVLDFLADPTRAAGHHLEFGELCERLGEFGLALTQYQLALRENPNEGRALERLSVLYEERGELEKAVEASGRWLEAAPGDPGAVRRHVELLVADGALEKAREVVRSASQTDLPEALLRELEALIEEEHEPAEEVTEAVGFRPPPDTDVMRFVHLFSGRENVYARQWCGSSGKTGYTPVREPFTPRVARAHLMGDITVGIYPVRLDNSVTFCAFDIDMNKNALARALGNREESQRLRSAVAEESVRLRRELEGLGIPALMEDSGYKGRHLWVFFERPEPASVVHQFGVLFMRCFPLRSVGLHLEFFPKQARVGSSGVGNLIKLPLGIHRKTGRRSCFLDEEGNPVEDPFEVLRVHPRVEHVVLHAAIEKLKSLATTVKEQPATTGEEGGVDEGTVVQAPAPPEPEPAWTMADFDNDPEVSLLLSECAVLRALKEKVEEFRQLTHDERVVLAHSLGHSRSGVLAVNYLFELCVDVPPEARLQKPFSGNPISCPKIRKRIPHVTGKVDCNCLFDFAPDHYPTPRLHLLKRRERGTQPHGDARESRGERKWDPVDRARALGVLWVKRARLEKEIRALETEIARYMEQNGVSEISTGDGVLRLIQETGGPPTLEWKPQEVGKAEDREAGTGSAGSARG
jgi:hypothetical protein